MTSSAVQDYLKVIFKLQHGAHGVTTSAIATRLGISAPSVTGMLKKLDQQGLVTHLPYKGVALTEPGLKIALEMIRHHRIIELYLQRALDFTWDRVDAEAESLEHTISQEMIDAMARVLGDPKEDPHGDPIPTREGELLEVRFDPLSAAESGSTVRIRRVKDSDSAVLRYLGELGMYPGTIVKVLEKAPFGGPVFVKVGDREHALGLPVCDSVFVEAAEAASRTRKR